MVWGTAWHGTAFPSSQLGSPSLRGWEGKPQDCFSITAHNEHGIKLHRSVCVVSQARAPTASDGTQTGKRGSALHHNAHSPALNAAQQLHRTPLSSTSLEQAMPGGPTYLTPPLLCWVQHGGLYLRMLPPQQYPTARCTEHHQDTLQLPRGRWNLRCSARPQLGSAALGNAKHPQTVHPTAGAVSAQGFPPSKKNKNNTIRCGMTALSQWGGFGLRKNGAPQDARRQQMCGHHWVSDSAFVSPPWRRGRGGGRAAAPAACRHQRVSVEG